MVLVRPSWMRDVKFGQGKISGYGKVPRFALSSSHVKVGFGVVLRSRRPHTLGVGYWGWGGFEMMTVLYWADLLLGMSQLGWSGDSVGLEIQGSMTRSFWGSA